MTTDDASNLPPWKAVAMTLDDALTLINRKTGPKRCDCDWQTWPKAVDGLCPPCAVLWYASAAQVQAARLHQVGYDG